jgi:hypothetical protein
MLEPWLEDWLREIGLEFFLEAGRLAVCGVFWRKWAGRRWYFDGDFVVNCVVDVVV